MLQTTNEELKSSNEELETTNEELQSTNQELETMNEELQSTNAELQTVNEELRIRSDELNHAERVLRSVLASLSAGAVVVDSNLDVLMWNHRAEDLWGLRADEVRGEGLLNLDIGLPVAELRTVIHSCLAGEADSPGSGARRGQPPRQENQMPRHLQPPGRRQQAARRRDPDDGRSLGRLARTSALLASSRAARRRASAMRKPPGISSVPRVSCSALISCIARLATRPCGAWRAIQTAAGFRPLDLRGKKRRPEQPSTSVKRARSTSLTPGASALERRRWGRGKTPGKPTALRIAIAWRRSRA